MLIAMLIYTIALYRLQSHMLTFRFQTPLYSICYIGVYILYCFESCGNDLIPNVPLKFIFLIILFLYIFFLYTDSYRKRIFWIAVSFVIQALCDIISMLFHTACMRTSLSRIMTNTHTQIAPSLVSALLSVLLVEYIIHKDNSKTIISYFQKEVTLLIVIDFLFIDICAGLFYFDSSFLHTNFAIYLTIFAVLLISLVAFITLYKVAKNSKKLMETNLKMQQMEMEHKLTQNLDDIVHNLRCLRHDMNNHLGVLQGFLDMQAYQEASDYLHSISEELMIANQYVFTSNHTLSVLLNIKISRATALGIPMETEILTDTIPLEDIDLCAIIGNLLENAIEAASLSEKPSISFSIQKKDDCLVICCDNSFSVKPIFRNGKLITTKKDKRCHGIGTQNIIATAQKYGGYVNFSVGPRFHACVSIPYTP